MAVARWLANGTNLAAIVAALSGAVAVFRYWRNSIRDRENLVKQQASAAVTETLNFLADRDVRAALSALDYSEPVTMQALRIHAPTYESEADGGFSDDEKLARDTIDQFLTRLEMINFLIDKKVVAEDDFRQQFNYWLELLGEIPRADDELRHLSDANRKALWHYIRTYRFGGVIQLFARYGRASLDKGSPESLFRAR